MTIEPVVGEVYRYNGFTLENNEEDRYYEVFEIRKSPPNIRCLHVSSGSYHWLSLHHWLQGQMDLVSDPTEPVDPVTRRIKLLHSRQANKHKFFSKEYST